MSETTMRVTHAVKSKIEAYKEKHFGRYSTLALYEVIDAIIQENESLKQKIKEKETEYERDRERVIREFVFVGEDLKRRLDQAENELGLSHPIELLDFLLELFESLEAIPKTAFKTFVRFRKNI